MGPCSLIHRRMGAPLVRCASEVEGVPVAGILAGSSLEVPAVILDNTLDPLDAPNWPLTQVVTPNKCSHAHVDSGKGCCHLPAGRITELQAAQQINMMQSDTCKPFKIMLSAITLWYAVMDVTPGIWKMLNSSSLSWGIGIQQDE